MQFGETIAVAFQSIRANKLRTALTMLGVIIGVAAVIAMVALGTGAQRAVEERIAALGANLLTVFPGQSFRQGVASNVRVSLTTDDAEAIARDAPLIEAVVPEMQSSLQVKYGNKNINANIVGTTANYAEVRNYTVPYGRMFSSGDDESRQRYAVLGHDVPEMLGANPAALIGQMLLVRGIPFEIIGILNRKGSAGSFQNPDEQILIPLETARYRIFGTDRLRSMTVKVAEGVPMEQGMVDFERVLRREHKIRPGADNDFQVRNFQDILATQQQATQVFTALLASIAGVSLLVGGIGIMNIMLVSVTERTREIGIRLAIGAVGREVLLQFLVEAIVLACLGGVIGLLLALVASWALAPMLQVPFLFDVRINVVAFAFSALIGVIFGYFPARQAAQLNPIDALRHE